MTVFINVNVENVSARKIYKERRAISDRDCKILYRFQPENILWLSYVGDLGFQSGVVEDLGVHRTTVSKVIADIATKIVEKAPLWIRFPSTEEEFEAAKADWQVSYKFPCAIGLWTVHIFQSGYPRSMELNI
jgi:hypothetical protein